MTLLATSDDLMIRLATPLTEAQVPRALALLDDAADLVRRVTGQDFTQATTTARLRIRNGRVTLPQRPVTAVSAVADVNGNPVLFSWLGDDQVSVSSNAPDSFAWEPWANGYSVVDVSYTHGYARGNIPGVVIAVICQVVSRALGRDPQDSGVQQESIAGYSYSLGAAGAAGPVGLLPDERAALEKFTRRAGVVQVGP